VKYTGGFANTWWREGNYWHYPCGTAEDPIPAVMDCDFECEFIPSIRADSLKYEFEG